MTKADLVSEISSSTGIDKANVLAIVEALMLSVSASLESGEGVFLRGFGSFVVKKRAEKVGRNISKGISITIPAHNVPSFKPADEFMEGVKANVKL